MGIRARIRAALVVVALAACAEGAEPGTGPSPGGDAAPLDASSPDETTPDGGSSRLPDAAPDPIDAGPPDASVTAMCDPDSPCAAGQCCHFFYCVAGTQTPLLCIVEPSVPTCSDAMPCGSGQCCHFGRCVPGAQLPGVCLPRTE